MKTNPFIVILSGIGAISLLFIVLFFAGTTLMITQLGKSFNTGSKDLSSILTSDEFETDGINADGHRIGVVEISGVLMESKEIIKKLDKFANSKDVKGIIIRIDSPGGTVAPAQEIYSKIMKIRSIKPVVASISNMAASGGYYVASAAEIIVANPGSMTGSIGVIMQHMNTERLIEFLKLEPDVLKAGEYKDSLSPLRKLTPTERQLLQTLLDDVHDQFKQDVAKNRNITPEEMTKIAQGQVFTGRQAMQLKLVDKLGSLEDAASEVLLLAKLEGTWQLVYPKKDSMFYLHQFFDSADTMVKTILDHKYSTQTIQVR